MAPDCQLMAVVKADGYGHGAVPVARAAAAGGASCFGVATLGEGLELRQAGVQEPVLVLGNLIQPEELRNCLQAQLMPTISTMREALLCQNLASGSGRPMAVHLKVDTGMTRLGADWQEGPRLAQAISNLDSIQLAGIYSHLAHADAPMDMELNTQDDLSRLQLQRYESVLAEVQNQGLAVGCRHLANSAGTLRHPSLHFDLVRVGLALYGHRPASHLGSGIGLRLEGQALRRHQAQQAVGQRQRERRAGCRGEAAGEPDSALPVPPDLDGRQRGNRAGAGQEVVDREG
jgi:alanine racemase